MVGHGGPSNSWGFLIGATIVRAQHWLRETLLLPVCWLVAACWLVGELVRREVEKRRRRAVAVESVGED